MVLYAAMHLSASIQYINDARLHQKIVWEAHFYGAYFAQALQSFFRQADVYRTQTVYQLSGFGSAYNGYVHGALLHHPANSYLRRTYSQ